MAPANGFSEGGSNGMHVAHAVYDHVPLHDVDMLEEIDLLGNLIVIATSTNHALSLAEIDSALGVVAPVLPTPRVPA